jgi:hypothetical protein
MKMVLEIDTSMTDSEILSPVYAERKRLSGLMMEALDEARRKRGIVENSEPKKTETEKGVKAPAKKAAPKKKGK